MTGKTKPKNLDLPAWQKGNPPWPWWKETPNFATVTGPPTCHLSTKCAGQGIGLAGPHNGHRWLGLSSVGSLVHQDQPPLHPASLLNSDPTARLYSSSGGGSRRCFQHTHILGSLLYSLKNSCIPINFFSAYLSISLRPLELHRGLLNPS